MKDKLKTALKENRVLKALNKIEKTRSKKLRVDLAGCKAHYLVLLNASNTTKKEAERFSVHLLRQQEEDRKAISRELHDEIGQLLTGINFELAILSKEAEKGEKRLHSKILNTQNMVKESVEIINRFARELRPVIIDDLGLIAALRSHIKHFSQHTSIRVKFRSHPRVIHLSEFNKLALFRVTQEALTNVAKHSKATRVEIIIRKMKDSIHLQIQDNGKSFDLRSLKVSKRLGLIGMKERLRIARGKLVVKTSKGKGTTIEAEIPFNRLYKK